MEKRYQKNSEPITEKEMALLKNTRLLVIGCGGLGGHIIEQCARLGIGQITAVDGDIFDETNLNRQLLSEMKNLGSKKVVAAEQRVLAINPDTIFLGFDQRLTFENIDAIIQNQDIVVDAVDNITTRLLLEKKCTEYQIPLVHGAIAGWYFQVSVVMPGDSLLSKIYGNSESQGIESVLGNPAFTPAAAASFQVAEVVKIILKKPLPIQSKLLYVDMLTNSMDIISFN